MDCNLTSKGISRSPNLFLSPFWLFVFLDNGHTQVGLQKKANRPVRGEPNEQECGL